MKSSSEFHEVLMNIYISLFGLSKESVFDMYFVSFQVSDLGLDLQQIHRHSDKILSYYVMCVQVISVNGGSFYNTPGCYGRAFSRLCFKHGTLSLIYILTLLIQIWQKYSFANKVIHTKLHVAWQGWCHGMGKNLWWSDCEESNCNSLAKKLLWNGYLLSLSLLCCVYMCRVLSPGIRTYSDLRLAETLRGCLLGLTPNFFSFCCCCCCCRHI